MKKELKRLITYTIFLKKNKNEAHDLLQWRKNNKKAYYLLSLKNKKKWGPCPIPMKKEQQEGLLPTIFKKNEAYDLLQWRMNNKKAHYLLSFKR